MSKEFQYKQRKTTDSYRKGWEKVFSGNKDTCPLCDDESDNHYWHTKCMRDIDNKPVQNMKFRTRVGIKEETTEQKQPNE